MTENCGFNSSQESLPLSQETFDSLLLMMDERGRQEMISHLNANNLGPAEWAQVASIQLQENSPHSSTEGSVPSPRSSLPATGSWPGVFDFQILFQPQGRVNKNTAWAYSEVDQKLYVLKDAVCPFSFRTNTPMSGDVFLRATAVYTSPEHASDVVHRCVNHSQNEIMQGIVEAEHLIRSESRSAHYEIDVDTERHSVIVPYENPPVGQDFSTYIFKFACFSSCPGGPNRRAMTLIFTLEQQRTVLGRVAVDLKICACPGRDRDRALKLDTSKPASSPPEPKKQKTDSNSISVAQKFFENFPKKKKLEEKNPAKKEEFIIRVKDPECYNFLLTMKKAFTYNKRAGRLTPEGQALLCIYKSSSSDDERC